MGIGEMISDVKDMMKQQPQSMKDLREMAKQKEEIKPEPELNMTDEQEENKQMEKFVVEESSTESDLDIIQKASKIIEEAKMQRPDMILGEELFLDKLKNYCKNDIDKSSNLTNLENNLLKLFNFLTTYIDITKN